MNHDTHSAALRAAAKLAFSVTFLGGCGGGLAAVDTDEAEASEYAVNAPSDTPAEAPRADASADACEDAEPTTHDGGKASCDSVLASTFGSPAWKDWNPWGWNEPTPEPVSEEVTACCKEHVGSIDLTSSETYRWECCGVLDFGRGANDTNLQMACTPWGPPVPPAMRPRSLGVA
jgi:hypothetical protein